MRSALRNWGKWKNTVTLSYRRLATKPAAHNQGQVQSRQDNTQRQVEESEQDQEYAPEYNIATRIERRQPKIKPMCKEIFSSEFNSELLAFPEILNKEELENLDQTLAAVRKGEVDLGGVLWGAQCQPVHGGTSANLTERCRILEEAPLPSALRIRDHWFGLDLVLGSMTSQDELAAFLPDYVSGKKKFRVLLRESLVDDPLKENMQTCIIRSVGDSCYISGTKIAEKDQNPDITNETLIVASAAGKYNFRMVMVQDNSTVQVKNNEIIFDETHSKVIASPKGPPKPANEINIAKDFGEALKSPMTNFRLGSAAISLNLIRDAIKWTMAQVKGKYMAGKPVVELPLFQDRIMNALTILYKVESMVYMTCGLADGYESPDIELESVLTRLMAMNGAVSSIFGLNDIVSALHITEGFSSHYTDAVNLMHRDEIMDMMTIYAGLLGIQYTAVGISEEIRKNRNPFHHPSYNFMKMFDGFFKNSKEPKLKLRLFEDLHPSLQQPSDSIEYCILRMKKAIVELVGKNGQDTPMAHRDIQRLCNAGCEIYAMVASIARASRSYCIGLANSEREVYMAAVMAKKGKEIVTNLLTQVEDGSYLNYDKTVESIVNANVKNKGPLMEHCLNRVYY